MDIVEGFHSCTGIYWCIGSLSVIVLLYIIGTWKFGTFKKMGISGPKPLPFIGNMLPTFKVGLTKADQDFCATYGKFFGYFLGMQPYLMVSDVDLLKQIFVKDFNSFSVRKSNVGVGYPMRKGLSMVSGDDWKRIRTLCSPTFTSGKLKNMTPLIEAAMHALNRRLVKAAEDEEEVDLKDYFGPMSMDVIARTMFCIELDDQTHNKFVNNAKKIMNFSFKNPFIWIILFFPSLNKYLEKIFPTGLFHRSAIEFFVNAVHSAIESRRISNENFHDFLALLLKAHNEVKAEEIGGESGRLSEEEILAQAVTFLVAGYATTASTMSACSYYLALNQSIQDRCREEIAREIGDEELTYENTSKLTYLEQCIMETLRLAPPANRLSRLCSAPTTLTYKDHEYKIPKGMYIGIPLSVLHFDEEIWPNPCEFNPDRFEAEEKQRRNPFYYMPFGMGPRNCIGQRFALLELRLGMASVLRQVRFHPCEKTPKQLERSKIGILQMNIPLKVEKV